MAILLGSLLKSLTSDFQKTPVQLSGITLSLWELLSRVFKAAEEKAVLTAFSKAPDAKNLSRLQAMISGKSVTDAFFRSEIKLLLQTGPITGKEPALPMVHETGSGFAAKKAVKKIIKKAGMPVRKVAAKAAAKKVAPKKASAPKPWTPRPPVKPVLIVRGGDIRTEMRPPRSGHMKRTTRNTPPVTLPSKTSGAVKPLATKKITCHAKAEMDQQLLLKKSSTVTVTISREQIRAIKNMATDIADIQVSPEKPLTITVRPVLNIRIKGKKSAVTVVPEPGNPVNEAFVIVPIHKGKCSLAVDVWQEQVPVCTLQLSAECVAEKAGGKKISVTAVTHAATPFPEAVNQLRITERQEGSSCYYDYELQSPALRIFKQFSSPAIKVNRADYVSKLYAEIENMWTTVAGNATQFANELRNFGAGLFTDLFPDELQQILFKQAKKINSIQVISTEPFIPWELVLIKKPGKQRKWVAGDRYLGELGLTRWLHGWWPAEQLVIGKGRARYVIPEYLHKNFQLPGAPEEKAYLEKEFGATAVPPDPVIVNKLLRKAGSFDLLHFCCHGEADTSNISHSKLMLLEKQKGGQLLPTYLTQTSVEECGTISLHDSRPIVVLNACQAGRMGTGLVGYGGFANAFLQAGAGAFIGSLWSIEDNAAVSFVTSLYDGLKSGKTLSEATVYAREVARKNKDATWISYVVYGHPFAKLK